MKTTASLLAIAALLGCDPGNVNNGSFPLALTTRVSLADDGSEAKAHCFTPVLSADGTGIAFESDASNLVPGDTNGFRDIYVRDTVLRRTTRATLSDVDAEPNAHCQGPAISGDGRYVAFISTATNLHADDGDGTMDVFVRDLASGTTTLVSRATGAAGAKGNGTCWSVDLSFDGQFAAFASMATNLVAGDTNATSDVFVRDLVALTTVRVSLDSAGVQAGGFTYQPRISGDGQIVAFTSSATNLVAGDTNGFADIFARDWQAVTPATTRVNVSSLGAQATGSSSYPALSFDGRYVVYESNAPDLVPEDTGTIEDVFRYDRQTGTTIRVSVNNAGEGCAGSSAQYPTVSADGNRIAFVSAASNLAEGDTNDAGDAFLRDVLAGATYRTSVTTYGHQVSFGSYSSSVSGDGSCVVFSSTSGKVVEDDTNGVADVFLRSPLP